VPNPEGSTFKALALLEKKSRLERIAKDKNTLAYFSVASEANKKL
jgi:hypothetical protein